MWPDACGQDFFSISGSTEFQVSFSQFNFVEKVLRVEFKPLLNPLSQLFTG